MNLDCHLGWMSAGVIHQSLGSCCLGLFSEWPQIISKEWDFRLLAEVSLRVLNPISIMRCPSALISKSLALSCHFYVVLEEEVLCVESTPTCVAMGSTCPPDTWGFTVSWNYPPASSDLVSFYLWGSQGLSSFQSSLENKLKGQWISFTSHFVF